MSGAAAVDAYIAAQPTRFAAALTHLRTRLRDFLPAHVECLSYAMPGFRAPGPKGKMVVACLNVLGKTSFCQLKK